MRRARTMSRTRMSLLLVVLMTSVVAASGRSAPVDIVYARPGRLVDAGGFRLNLYCMGSGSPTVVFDSGWEDWAPAWSKVQPEIAKWTRACSYDRAGTGFRRSRSHAPYQRAHCEGATYCAASCWHHRAVHSGWERVRRRQRAHVRRARSSEARLRRIFFSLDKRLTWMSAIRKLTDVPTGTRSCQLVLNRC